MAPDSRQLPDVLLERYLAGDLSAETRGRIEAEREVRPEVRARLDALAREKDAFLAAVPPADFARLLARRLEVEGIPAPERPRWRLAWVLAPSTAAAVALLTAITVTQRSTDESALLPMTAAPSQNTGAAPSGAGGGGGEVHSPAPSAASSESPRRKPRRGSSRRSAKLKRERKTKRAPRPMKRDAELQSEMLPNKSAAPVPPQVVPPETTEGAVSGALEAVPVTPAEAPVDSDESGADGAVQAEEERSGSAPRASSEAPRGLPRAVVSRIVIGNARLLTPCLKSNDEVAAGDLVLELAWRIARSGRVEEPRWVRPTALRKTALAECVLKEVQKWRFPRAPEPTVVEHMELPVTVKD